MSIPDTITLDAQTAREIAAALGDAAEISDAATDYALLIQVENFDRNDIAVRRAYERLRIALGGQLPPPAFSKLREKLK